MINRGVVVILSAPTYSCRDVITNKVKIVLDYKRFYEKVIIINSILPFALILKVLKAHSFGINNS